MRRVVVFNTFLLERLVRAGPFQQAGIGGDDQQNRQEDTLDDIPDRGGESHGHESVGQHLHGKGAEQYLLMGISMGGAIYYFLYNCGDAGWFGTMVTASCIGSVAGLVITPWLVKKCMGIRALNLGAFSINFLLRIVFLILALQFIALSLVILYGFVSLTMCTLGSTFNALVSEASDYTFLKTGKRLDGSMYSCTSFGMKVGGGLGSAISGWLLAASHFDSSAAVQPVECTNMLTFMIAGVPLIITAIVIFIYLRLDVEKVNQKLRGNT